MAFDLSKNNFAEQAENGFEFELMIPELLEKTGAFIKVRGVNSPKVKAFFRKKFQESSYKDQMAKKRNKDPEPMTLDDAEDFAIESTYVRIISWKGFEEDGEVLAFTEDNAKRILRDHPWIREAIIEQSDTLTNFLQAR